MTTSHATPDPRVQAANIKAAARDLAEAAARREDIEAQLSDLRHEPASAARLARLFTLRFKLSAAEYAERCALHVAHRAGLQEGQEYPATVQGAACFVCIDGPCVSLYYE